jgi:hypothetical protein
VTPPEVEVEITERIATDEEVAKEMRALGFVKITGSQVALPSKLGAHLHQKGVIRHQRGGAFMNQHRLSSTVEVLHARLIEVADSKPGAKKENQKTEQMCKLAHAIGYNASKLTESQELVIGSEGGRGLATPPLPNAEAPPNMAFPVGTTVPKEVHYHVHQNEPKPEAKNPVAEKT